MLKSDREINFLSLNVIHKMFLFILKYLHFPFPNSFSKVAISFSSWTSKCYLKFSGNSLFTIALFVANESKNEQRVYRGKTGLFRGSHLKNKVRSIVPILIRAYNDFPFIGTSNGRQKRFLTVVSTSPPYFPAILF